MSDALEAKIIGYQTNEIFLVAYVVVIFVFIKKGWHFKSFCLCWNCQSTTWSQARIGCFFFTAHRQPEMVNLSIWNSSFSGGLKQVISQHFLIAHDLGGRYWLRVVPGKLIQSKTMFKKTDLTQENRKPHFSASFRFHDQSLLICRLETHFTTYVSSTFFQMEITRTLWVARSTYFLEVSARCHAQLV